MVHRQRSRFHCKGPIKNKKNSLLALIFTQITPNLEESVVPHKYLPTKFEID